MRLIPCLAIQRKICCISEAGIGDGYEKNFYLSPLFGDYTGFPPMLMQVGSYEVLPATHCLCPAKPRRRV